MVVRGAKLFEDPHIKLISFSTKSHEPLRWRLTLMVLIPQLQPLGLISSAMTIFFLTESSWSTCPVPTTHTICQGQG